MTTMFAKCYIALGNYSNAQKILIPNILDNALADNSDLVRLAYQTLLRSYSKTQLRQLFEIATRNYQAAVHNEGTEDEYTTYSIVFLNRKIEIPSWGFDFLGAEKSNKAVEAYMSKSLFARLLTE